MKRTAIVFVLAAVLAPATHAQRASRPADDWIATLEAPERVSGLKIPEVVAAMKLRPGDVVAIWARVRAVRRPVVERGGSPG